MAQLRAGGLAIIIKSQQTEFIGRCVELVEIVQSGIPFKDPINGRRFQYDDQKYPRAWLVIGHVSTKTWTDVDNEMRDNQGWSVYSGAALMPIDGDDSRFIDEMKRESFDEISNNLFNAAAGFLRIPVYKLKGQNKRSGDGK